MINARGHHSSPSNPFPTILVVQSEEAFRNLAGMIIGSQGYKVLTARDGREALLLFSQFHSEISLVLSDVRLNGMDAEGLLKRMRQIDPGTQLIVTGSYFDTKLKSDLKWAGADGYLEYPVGVEQILDKIQDVLDANVKTCTTLN